VRLTFWSPVYRGRAVADLNPAAAFLLELARSSNQACRGSRPAACRREQAPAVPDLPQPDQEFQDKGIWNYSKFVTLTNGGAHGTNVKPSVAANTFGPQTCLFTGGKIRFPVNRGTAGPFTQVGTINNAAAPGF